MDYHVTTRRILDADVHQRVESAQVRDVNPPPSAGTTSTYHAKGNRSGIGPAKQARNPTLPSRHSVSLRPRPHCKGNPAKSSRAGLPPEPRRTRPSLPHAAGVGRWCQPEERYRVTYLFDLAPAGRKRLQVGKARYLWGTAPGSERAARARFETPHQPSSDDAAG